MEFKENREKYLGLAEATAGFGLMMGPVLGSLVYSFTNYVWTFIIFGIILAFNLIFIYSALPNELNFAPDEEEDIEEDGQVSVAEPIVVTYGMFIKNRQSLFAFISCTLVCVYASFNEAFVSLVIESYDISESYVGYILAIPCAMYIISAALVSNIIGAFPRRLFILIAFLISGVSLFL